MENGLQKLPIGVQSFEDLRTNDYLYVDKTKEIFKLVNSGKSFFLSRPRRFGKSLLVSTLENLFLGNKELFKDLYIYDKWDWNETYPVIRIDFSGRSHETGVELKKSLNIFLTELAKENGVELVYENHNDKFGELIKKLYGKYGKVVVLVDEYDKPILDNISYPTVRDDMKKILHDFYQILKSQDDNLRFVFLTGVSKFVGTSIFS
ncbi:MAG: AAA family ATPase, partial [Methanobrevibacter sp.]|nr:AAA family ATPase [Candidatus Methanovirga procula]